MKIKLDIDKAVVLDTALLALKENVTLKHMAFKSLLNDPLAEWDKLGGSPEESIKEVEEMVNHSELTLQVCESLLSDVDKFLDNVEPKEIPQAKF